MNCSVELLMWCDCYLVNIPWWSSVGVAYSTPNKKADSYRNGPNQPNSNVHKAKQKQFLTKQMSDLHKLVCLIETTDTFWRNNACVTNFIFIILSQSRSIEKCAKQSNTKTKSPDRTNQLFLLQPWLNHIRKRLISLKSIMNATGLIFQNSFFFYTFFYPFSRGIWQQNTEILPVSIDFEGCLNVIRWFSCHAYGGNQCMEWPNGLMQLNEMFISAKNRCILYETAWFSVFHVIIIFSNDI